MADKINAREKRLEDIALQLLEMYHEEKEKQIVAMRMAANSAAERDKAKTAERRLWREIASIREDILRD